MVGPRSTHLIGNQRTLYSLPFDWCCCLHFALSFSGYQSVSQFCQCGGIRTHISRYVGRCFGIFLTCRLKQGLYAFHPGLSGSMILHSFRSVYTPSLVQDDSPMRSENRSRGQESNLQPPDYKSGALPLKLPRLKPRFIRKTLAENLKQLHPSALITALPPGCLEPSINQISVLRFPVRTPSGKLVVVLPIRGLRPPGVHLRIHYLTSEPIRTFRTNRGG